MKRSYIINGILILISLLVVFAVIIIAMPSLDELEEQKRLDLINANIFCQEEGYFNSTGDIITWSGSSGSWGKLTYCIYEDGHKSERKQFDGESGFPMILIIVIIAGIIISALVIFSRGSENRTTNSKNRMKALSV